MQQGMIMTVGTRKPGLFQKLIKFFTESEYTHAALTCQSVNKDSMLEAGMSVHTVPFKSRYQDDPDGYYRIYKLNPALFTQEEIDKALDETYEALAGKTYAFLQLPWFAYRWFNKKILRRDIHAESNWFDENVICTGEVFHYWIALGMGMIIPNVMSQFHPSTVSPSDIIAIEQSNPQVFTLEEQKD